MTITCAEVIGMIVLIALSYLVRIYLVEPRFFSQD
jgi:hypothetical protein